MFYRENGQFKTSYRADQQIFPIAQDRIALALLLAVLEKRVGLELMGVVVRGFHNNGARAFKILLLGASQGTFRGDAGVLTIGDDLGRVTAIALEHGTIIGRFAVSV